MQQENSSHQEISSQMKNVRKNGLRRGRGRGRGRARRPQVEEHTRNNRSKSRSRSRSRSDERERREHNSSQQASENGRDLSQSHSNEESSNESQNNIISQPPCRTAPIQIFADSICQNFVDFFYKCGHEKGFVFTPQERKKMKKEDDRLFKKNKDYKRIDWKDEHQWDPDREMDKVNRVFQNNNLNLPIEKKEELKAIFKTASGMFADQVTIELYAFLFEILQIACIPNEQQQKEKIKLLLREVQSDSQKWRFFGFHFSTYFKVRLSKEQQQRIHQKLVENLLAILKQKI